MKLSYFLTIVLTFIQINVFAARYAESQYGSCPTCPNQNFPRTSEVYRPNYGPRKPSLDYESNELSKRLPTEHFTFDPEEDGLTRR